MINKIILFFLGVLFMLPVAGQQRKVRELRYLDQLQHLQNGMLIVDLPTRPQASGIVDMRSKEGRAQVAKEEKALSLYKAIRSHYSYSDYLFRFPEGGDTLYIDSFGMDINFPKSLSQIFILEQVEKEPTEVEITYENRKGDQWLPEKKYLKDGENSEYDKSINSFDPEYIGSGGLIIRREAPLTKAESKNRRIRVNYFYRSRLNSVSPVNERYKHSVEYLNRKLERELKEYLKKYG